MSEIQIRVSNVNWNASAEQIQAFLSTFLKVKELKLVTDREKRSKGLAYVTLETENDLNVALQHDNEVFMERQLRIIKALPQKEKNSKQQVEDIQDKRKNKQQKSKPHIPYFKIIDENSIYVANVNWNTSELALGKFFEHFGDIQNVKIIEDDKGNSRGFGYIEFEHNETVEKALEANGTTLDGRVMKVQRVNRVNVKKSENKIENK